MLKKSDTGILKKKKISKCYLTISMIEETSSEQMIGETLIPNNSLPLIKLLGSTVECYFIKENE